MGPRRVSELTNARMGDFELRRGKWWWRIQGKGGKTERVSANSDVMAALSRYRRFLGMAATREPHEKTPLVLDLRGEDGISADMIYRIVRDTCEVQRTSWPVAMRRKPRNCVGHHATRDNWYLPAC